MMKRTNLLAVLVISVFAATAVAGDYGHMKDKKDMKMVSMKKLPDPVRETVSNEAGDKDVCHVKKALNEEGNTEFYKAVWRKNDEAVKLKVKPNGQVMSRSTDEWVKHDHHHKMKESTDSNRY